jgi:hypothetical protein
MTITSVGTVNASNITGTVAVTNGGTNSNATPTAGAVAYGNGSAYAFTSAGTTGQVLTSAGSGAPTWTTPSSGAMTLISTLTASSSNYLTWTGLSGYDKYLLIYENIVASATNAILWCQIGTGATPTYLTSGYNGISCHTSFNGASASVTAVQDSARAGFLLVSRGNVDYSSSCFINGYAQFNGFTSGVGQSINSQSITTDSINGLYDLNNGGQFQQQTSNVTAIQVFFGNGSATLSGNITSGKISLYGISS